MRASLSVLAALLLVGVSAASGAADSVPARLDEARQLYQKGDLARAANTLQGVVDDIQTRLGDGFMQVMPKPPEGWDGGEAQAQGLAMMGGGLTVMRGYQKGDSTLNATLIMDSPAVAGVLALLSNPTVLTSQPGMKRVEIGGEQAVLRWDGEARSGEVMLVLGGRVLLQVEGSELPGSEPLVALMSAWDIAGVKRIAGL